MPRFDTQKIANYIDAIREGQVINYEDFLGTVDPIFWQCLTRKHYTYRETVQDDLHQEFYLWLLRVANHEIKLPSHSYTTWLYFCIDKLISRWCQKNLAEVPIGNVIIGEYFPDTGGDLDD